jgi:DNA-binding LytR/AlgR family response regulator
MEKIFVKNENEIRFIYLENLTAIRVENYLCTFFIENEARFSCTQSLKETATLLPDFFIQINRNCIVNVNKIKSIYLKDRKVLMQDNIEHPVSVHHIKTLKKYLQDKSLKTQQK